MKDTTLSRLGGSCSILAGLALLVVPVLLVLGPADQQQDPYTCHCADTYLPSLAHTSTLHIAGLGVLAVYSLLAVAAVLAISETVRAGHEGWVRWSSTLAIVGLVTNAIDALRHAALDPAVAAAYVEGDAAVKAALTVPGALTGLDPQGWFKFGGVGFWVLVVSLLALRSGAWPRALAIMGLVVTVAFWLVVTGEVMQSPSQSLLAIPALIGAGILTPLWYIWLGLRLRRVA
jgi:hypothetical protein